MAAVVHSFLGPEARSLPPLQKEKHWRVVHACDSIRSVSDLVEAQIVAGMRPFVLTGETAARNASLIETWAAVRAWKRHLEESDTAAHPLSAGVVHAHSFAAAMAGLRGGLTTVYDVRAFVEDFAVAAGQCTERSWLARSFRAAEDFVLPRVGAVVVHSSLMRTACRGRGVDADDLFLVPTPLQMPHAAPPDKGWLRRAFDFRDDIVTIFARPNVAEDETLMRAFAQTVAEVPGSRLFLASSGEQTTELRRFAHQAQVEECVFFLAPEDEGPALCAADIVLAGWPVFPDDSPWGRMHSITIAGSGTALTAMAQGCCLLAADCSAHRDLTPEGRGCLWFGGDPASDGPAAKVSMSSGASTGSGASANGDATNRATNDAARDLAHRLAFLARNPDMRRALGETGRRHLAETRDPERIGRMYQEVYRHAHQRRHRGDDAHGQTPLLIPAQNVV